MSLDNSETGIINDPDILVLDEKQDEPTDGTDNEYGKRVILFNDNFHSFQEVINQIMKAVKCNEETAFYYANTAHEKGKSQVYSGTLEECQRVESILGEILLTTKIVN